MTEDKNLLGYLGIDQFGGHYHMKKYPRKELLEQLGAASGDIMYCDTTRGEARRKGYVIKGLWISVLKVYPAYEEVTP